MDNHTLFSSFGKWLAPICTRTFTDRVFETRQDKYAKKLTTSAYLKLFLHAQLQGREGLRHIADDVLSKAFQQELGLTSISAAQLSRKHKQVNPDLLQHVFERLVQADSLRRTVHRLIATRSGSSTRQPLPCACRSTNGPSFARLRRASSSTCDWHLSANRMSFRRRQPSRLPRRMTAHNSMSLSMNLASPMCLTAATSTMQHSIATARAASLSSHASRAMLAWSLWTPLKSRKTVASAKISSCVWVHSKRR